MHVSCDIYLYKSRRGYWFSWEFDSRRELHYCFLQGENVDEFQPLCEVQSDKATIEITSRYKGKVARIFYVPGDIVKVSV